MDDFVDLAGDDAGDAAEEETEENPEDIAARLAGAEPSGSPGPPMKDSDIADCADMLGMDVDDDPYSSFAPTTTSTTTTVDLTDSTDLTPTLPDASDAGEGVDGSGGGERTEQGTMAWMWEKSDDMWEPYRPDIVKKLNAAVAKGKKKVQFFIGVRSFIIDFENMAQKNGETDLIRRIKKCSTEEAALLLEETCKSDGAFGGTAQQSVDLAGSDDDEEGGASKYSPKSSAVALGRGRGAGGSSAKKGEFSAMAFINAKRLREAAELEKKSKDRWAGGSASKSRYFDKTGAKKDSPGSVLSPDRKRAKYEEDKKRREDMELERVMESSKKENELELKEQAQIEAALALSSRSPDHPSKSSTAAKSAAKSAAVQEAEDLAQAMALSRADAPPDAPPSPPLLSREGCGGRGRRGGNKSALSDMLGESDGADGNSGSDDGDHSGNAAGGGVEGGDTTTTTNCSFLLTEPAKRRKTEVAEGTKTASGKGGGEGEEKKPVVAVSSGGSGVEGGGGGAPVCSVAPGGKTWAEVLDNVALWQSSDAEDGATVEGGVKVKVEANMEVRGEAKAEVGAGAGAGAEEKGAKGDEGESGAVKVGEGQPCESRYTLRSIVRHVGKNAFSGHYNTDVRCSGGRDGGSGGSGSEGGSGLKKNETGWKRYDDSTVSPITADNALGSASQSKGYLYFFELTPELVLGGTHGGKQEVKQEVNQEVKLESKTT